MIKQTIYDDYLLVKQMSSPMYRKSRILTDILAQYDGFWKVVGITEEALRTFAESNFTKNTTRKINRSHITQDRMVTNTYLLSNDLSFDEFWEYVLKNDVTVLATSSENSTNRFSRIIEVNTDLNLFKASGYGWTHNKREKEYLRELHRTTIGEIVGDRINNSSR